MSYVTVIWSVIAAGSLLLAIQYGLVWVMDRTARPSLAFAFECLSVVGSVVVELGMMYSTTPGEWGEVVAMGPGTHIYADRRLGRLHPVLLRRRPRPACSPESCPTGAGRGVKAVLWVAAALWVVAALLNLVLPPF